MSHTDRPGRRPLALTLLLAAGLATSLPLVTDHNVSGQATGQIAFMSDRDGDFDLYVMNADGSNQRALTQNAVEDRDPQWSPDGRRLVFTSRRDGDLEIYTVDVMTGVQRRLTTARGGDHTATWSPDGRRVAFVSERETQSDIYVVNVDGSGLRRLTTHAADDYRPRWAPNGRELLFHSQRLASNNDGSGELFIVSVDGGEPRRLHGMNRQVTSSQFSPDGKRVLFGMAGGRRLEVGVIGIDGTGEVNLSAVANSNGDSEPSWAPDGRRIALLGDRDMQARTGLFIINSDGSGGRRVSTADQAVTGPFTWSPDATQVAYAAFVAPNWDIFAVGAAGAPRRLTTSIGSDMGPVWARAVPPAR